MIRCVTPPAGRLGSSGCGREAEPSGLRLFHHHCMDEAAGHRLRCGSRGRPRAAVRRLDWRGLGTRGISCPPTPSLVEVGRIKTSIFSSGGPRVYLQQSRWTHNLATLLLARMPCGRKSVFWMPWTKITWWTRLVLSFQTDTCIFDLQIYQKAMYYFRTFYLFWVIPRNIATRSEEREELHGHRRLQGGQLVELVLCGQVLPMPRGPVVAKVVVSAHTGK